MILRQPLSLASVVILLSTEKLWSAIDWDNDNAVSSDFGDVANWVGTAVPGSGEGANLPKVDFPATIRFQPVVTGSIVLDQLEFDNGDAADPDWTLDGSGATITFETGGDPDLKLRGVGATVIGPDIIFSGGEKMQIDVADAGGVLQLHGDLSGTTSELELKGRGALVVTGEVGDAGSIISKLNIREDLSVEFNGNLGGTLSEVDLYSGGTVELNGSGSFSGPIAVRKGTNYFNGNFSGATGAVTVTGGSTVLGGTGTIGGETLFDDGILSPGDGPGEVGTLTFSQGLTVDKDTTWLLDIGDLVSVGGNLQIESGAALLITGPADIHDLAGPIVFATSGGTITGDFDPSDITYNGSAFPNIAGISWESGTGTLAVVPEPGVVVPLAASLLPWVLWRRRRRSPSAGSRIR